MNLFAETTDLRPFKRLLIANRGEIAVRIIRACRDEGIETVVVYAESDRDALFVRMADHAYTLDGERPADTYLNIAKIIDIAKKANVDAIHPGYGFLAERSDFAEAVQQAGIVWIGPDPQTIRILGDKIEARHIAEAVGAPLVAGTSGSIASAQEAIAFAQQHGLPIAIKAAFGGGGRGLKVAWRLEEIEELFESATREALTAFGRGECYVEQFLDRPRHIEAQILADMHGKVKVIGTRDCSLQRRNQKLVEEAPAPFLSDEQRLRIETSARAICAHAGYCGAGTVEFLLSSNGTISFLEVNTRLQVEHCVSEETTGIDLVRGMIRIAQGAKLLDETTPLAFAHSIEFRINAEDPARGFLPTPGPITKWNAPSGPGIRMDSGVETGSIVSGSFDSLMAKLIVTGATREEALQRARRALSEFQIEGVASVLPFDRAVLNSADFCAVDGTFKVHTRWIETDFADELEASINVHPRVTAAQTENLLQIAIEIDGKRHQLGLPANLLSLQNNQPETARRTIENTQTSDNDILSPVAGNLSLWNVENGQAIEKGQQIAVIEAMKMETIINAPSSGILQHDVDAGAAVQYNTRIGTII
ncbi:acetyl/propionyl/methylcrotonyl-CoA carboxylase subunit alpha [Brucellaceae bacterium C25G]